MLMQELGEPVGIVLSWMLTYLIHSTILILGVWLICRGIRPLAKRIGPGAENLGWKLALLGGFATATVQIAAGVTPALGALELETGPELVEQQALESQPRSESHQRATSAVVVIPSGEEQVMLGAGPLPTASLGPAPVSEAPTVVESSPAPLWPQLLLGAWLLGVLVALTRLGVSVIALRRRLADRSEVIEDPVLEAFLTLCRDADIRRKIRLTQSANIASPLALWRREVVVPQRAVEELSPVAMRSVLAHELAHLERRDPHWLALAAVIEALFFFQPLNRLARRGMQESAELLCDDWAIARTGDGVQFAKSLAELASWAKANRSPSLVAAMISGERPLVRRVRRALDGDPRRFDEEEGPRPTRVLLGIGTLAALIMVAPGAVDASPPDAEKAAKPSKDEARARRKARKAREKAEKKAEQAAERARAAKLEAEKAQREAEQAQREAERLAREAQREAEARARAAGPQHLIIRDGEDYLIIDENGVRMRADGAEIDIVDGANPRMRLRVHEGGTDFDLDVDLDTLESMADMFLGGGGGFMPPPGAPHSPGAPPPGPQGFGPGFDPDDWSDAMDAWGQDMDAWGRDMDAWGEALEREVLEELERERQRREGHSGAGGVPHAPPHAPMPPSPAPAAPAPVPVAPAPAPAPLIPA
jgi:beta-lactamase regulating signal transducer with metallopeptidase domain